MDPQPVFLLIEDNEDDALLIKRAFLQARLLNRLVVVPRAEEAREYLLGRGQYKDRAEFPMPDLLLLDLTLPDMSGFDFLQWLRAQPGFGKVAVTVVTSSNLQQDKDKALRLGANSYLVKPVDFEKLVEISRALSGYLLWLAQPPVA